MTEIIKVVDVDKALQNSKSPRMRKLPKFLRNFLKKTICQDELNKIHTKYAHLWGMDYVKALLFDEFKVKIDILGEEKVQKDKLYVYVANHPLGAIDALAFLYLIDKLHGKVVSPSNQLFEYIPNLHPVIVGIDVFKQNTKDKIAAVNKAFETDNQIMIFPAGEVSRKIGKTIEDPQWQKTFVSKAVQFQRDIVPVHISGSNSRKFYRIAKFRKFLGIKAYLETSLLPQEMLKQYNLHLTMTINEPINYNQITNSNLTHQQWADKIKQSVYQTKK